MTIVTIDGRSFTPALIKNTISTDCTLDSKQNSYIDFFFTEDGKQHFVRQATHFNKDECSFEIDYDVPAEWYVKE